MTLRASRPPSSWSGVAQAYAGSFARLCRGTVPRLVAFVEPGATVLDVGSGTGTLARALADAGAEVTAVDSDAEMVALTATATQGGAAVVQGALPRLPFRAATFDSTIANFVVNHLPDPRSGVRELARVTAAGGTVVATIWPSGRTAQSRLFDAVVVEARAVPPPSAQLAPELDFPRSAEGLAAILAEAGLVDVSVEEHRWDWRVPPETFWAGVQAGIGGVGATYTGQTGEVRRRMDAAFERLAEPLVTGEDLVLPSTAILGRAARPASWVAQVAGDPTPPARRGRSSGDGGGCWTPSAR